MALDPIAQAMEQYRQLPRALHADARYHMSQETADIIRRTSITYIEGPPAPDAMLGIPVIIDSTVPYGTVELRRRESPFERMVRKARASGVTVNVMQPIYSAPASEPTLRALLRHWARKLRKR